MKSLSGSLTWIASEKLLRPRAKFCFSSPCCRNWWAAVLSQPSGANPHCLMSCFNFQWETKYQKVHALHSLFFLSLFPSSILPSELHSQVLVKEMRSESFPFSLVLGILSHPATQGASSFPQISGVGTGVQWPVLLWAGLQRPWRADSTVQTLPWAMGQNRRCYEITPALQLVPSPFFPTVVVCTSMDLHDYPG